MPEKTARHDPYAALRINEFRFFLAARFFMTIGFQMIAVIVGWQIYEETKDPLSLGLIGLTEALPAIVVALYAGHVADQYNRKKIILSFLSLILICALLLFSFTLRHSYILNIYHVLPIYIVVLFIGLGRGFLAPAIFAFLAQIVPRQTYANSAAWNSNIWQIAAVAGPALGGLIYGFYGITTAYATAALSISIAFGFFLNIKARPLPPRLVKEPLAGSLLSGVKFVFGTPALLGAISLDLFAVLFGGAVALLPIFSSEILHAGPEGLGLLRAAPAAGAVVMAFLLAYYPPTRNAGRKLMLSVAGFGLCMIGFALSRNFYLSLALLAVSGMLDNVSVVVRSTILQLLTPDHMRGRVSSVNSIFIGSSNEIGAFESGVAAKFMGVVASVVFGGSMTLLVVLISVFRAPSLRKLNLETLEQE